MKRLLILSTVLFSFNANAQWNYIKDFDIVPGSATSGMGTDGLDDIYLINDSTLICSYRAWYCCSSGYAESIIFRSTNYGASWSIVDYFPDVAYWSFSSLSTNDSILRTNGTNIQYSTTQGTTWDSLPSGNFEILPYGIGSFNFLNANEGLIHQWNNDSLYSYKYGVVTVLPNFNTSGYFGVTRIKMLSSVKALILCETGHKLISTTDGGTTWSTVLDTGMLMTDMVFLDSLSGYISCVDGMVYKTINGGNSWTLLNTGTNKDLFSCSIYSDTLVYFSGESGTILRTKDGGVSWSDQSMPWLGNLFDINTSKTKAYCRDNDQIIYRNDNVNSIQDSEINEMLFQLFPNPTRNQFTISNPSSKKINSIQLLNSLGQLEYSQTIGNNNAQIKVNLPPLPSGIKYCRINGEENYTYKIIIE